GRGRDVVIDSSRVSGFADKVVIITEPLDTEPVVPGPSAEIKVAEEEFMHVFDRTEFKYDYLGPRLYFEYNADDGLYLGAGLYNEINGFKKIPHKFTHFLRANYATRTGAANYRYSGMYYSIIDHGTDL